MWDLLDRLQTNCTFCGLPAAATPTCQRCEAVLPRNDPACELCGQPLASLPVAGVPCADCQSEAPPWTRARGVFRYRFPVDVALKQLKYKGQMGFARAFARLLLPEVEQHFADCDALLPVPLHHWRQARRGFNQAEALCRPIAHRTKLPLIKNIRRVRMTASQSGLDPSARRSNLAGAFAVRGKLTAHHPLIVDDVITTGATAANLAITLLDAGAERVSVLAVASADRP